MAEVIDQICDFLDRIGIRYAFVDDLDGTFLPGLAIANGTLKVDKAKLTYPGDLLHEAGHIALTEPDKRDTLDQSVLDAQAPHEGEEIGVILWTYFAAKEIGLAPDVVFHAGGYKEGSQWLIDQFDGGTFIGLPLLVWMNVAENPVPGEVPRIKSWLRS